MLGIDPKVARAAWTYAMVALSISAVYLVRRTLLVFFIALMFAYLLYPLVEAVARHMPARTRTQVVILPFLLILGLAGACWAIVRKPIRNEIVLLKQQISDRNFKPKLENWKPLGLPIGHEVVGNYPQIENQILSLAPQLGRGVRAATRWIFDLFIIPVFSFLLLKDGPKMCDCAMQALFGAEPGRGCVSEKHRFAASALKDAHLLLLHYMRSIFILCSVTLVTFALGLSLMRVPYALLLAFLAFLLEFVPLAGPLSAAVIIAGACMFNGYEHLSWVIGFLLGYRLFQDYVLSPHVMRKGIKLHPLLVMLGVLAGGQLGGIAGIFLSVPVLALIRLVYYEWRKNGWNGDTPMVAVAVPGRK